jgi:hypothetical protein
MKPTTPVSIYFAADEGNLKALSEDVLDLKDLLESDDGSVDRSDVEDLENV